MNCSTVSQDWRMIARSATIKGFVIWHNNLPKRAVATQDHMATLLSLEVVTHLS